MKTAPEVKFDVNGEELYSTLIAAPLPLRLRDGGLTKTHHRDIYFDTGDKSLARRGVSCRLRIRTDDTRTLAVRIQEIVGKGTVLSDQCFEAVVPEAAAEDALRGQSEPARRLQAFISPDRLTPALEVETERVTRIGRSRLFRWPQFEFRYDVVTVREGNVVQSFREMKIRQLSGMGPSLEEVADTLQEEFQLRTLLSTKAERGEKRVRAMESEILAREVQESREVTVIGLEDRRILLLYDGTTMSLPVISGTGEETAREMMRDHLGTVDGQIRLLGTAAAAGKRPLLEVWLADGLREGIAQEVVPGRQWILMDEVISRAGSPVLRDPSTLAALAILARTNILPQRNTAEYSHDALTVGHQRRSMVTTRETMALTMLQVPELPETSLDATQPVPDQFINEQLSWLEFNARVLALAEDPGTPLLARLLFLSIFSANLDEFFMVRIGLLKHAVAEGVMDESIDGLTAQEELDAISVRLAPLIDRQQQLFRYVCIPDLEHRGIHLRRWEHLSETARDTMREFFDKQIFPVLTPHAMTHAPGHPFPHLENLSLSLAVMLRDAAGGPIHFAHIKIPSGIPRFVPLKGNSGYVPVEDIIAPNLQSLYPGREIIAVHPFRITRSGDIQIDEGSTSNLLKAVEEEVRRRPFGSVVRIEVDERMPKVMRDLLQRELSFEDTDHVSTLGDHDIVEADDLVDLGALKELAALDRPELTYPPFTGYEPFDPDRSIFDIIREGDRLVHHPYETFDSTVQRFIQEAATDPDVLAIKLTLYRSGSQSEIIEALTEAAREGKDVSVFVELKARFDEERNIHWARKLESAGIHVVTGLVKLKTHAKTSLVVRREGDEVRRYVHIGTGNYNASTAKLYTDLGLFSCDPELGADLHDLFNEFTGSSEAPRSKFRKLLVAPRRMRKQIVALIEAESEHARAGRYGRIRAKLNGLADKEIIAALYRASQAGVEIDLIVRGICSLRPGIPGLSDRIRVFSILGRFLEHARIFHFGNGGDDRYFIGSADWRPRNLRRRVEVVTPVLDPEACRRLDEILEMELDDPTGWQMRSDGGYGRMPPAVGVDCVSAQEQLIARAQARQAAGVPNP